MDCLLCSALTKVIEKTGDPRRYFQCIECDFLFLDPSLRLKRDQEKQRYLTHNNDIHDENYQKFVHPLVDLIRSSCEAGAQGLDFGSGTGPVLSHLLNSAGYDVAEYDPFFAYHPEHLERTYDFIVSCEVVEHLYNPLKELKRLEKMLRPGGVLGIMTLMWQGEDVFDWYYPRDPTHVVFFSEKNLNWLKEKLNFRSILIQSPRLVSFYK